MGYAGVYLFCSLVFATSAGEEMLPEGFVRWAIVGFCAETSLFSFLAPSFGSASIIVRVSILTAIGTGLGVSLLVSVLILVRICLELCGVLPPHGSMAEGLLNA